MRSKSRATPSGALNGVLGAGSCFSRIMHVARPTLLVRRYSMHHCKLRLIKRLAPLEQSQRLRTCAVAVVSTTMWLSAPHAVVTAQSYLSSIVPRSPDEHANIRYRVDSRQDSNATTIDIRLTQSTVHALDLGHFALIHQHLQDLHQGLSINKETYCKVTLTNATAGV